MKRKFLVTLVIVAVILLGPVAAQTADSQRIITNQTTAPAQTHQAAGIPLKPPAPKLTTEQIAQANQLAAAAQVADLEKQLAEAKQTISRQAQQLLIIKACWAAGVPEKSCEVQADGSLVKPDPKPVK